MNYYLYHDESKVEGYWHGILLIPEDKKSTVTALLDEVRANTQYNSEIGIKKVKDRSGKVFGCAQGFLNVGVYSLISDLKGKKYVLDLRGKNKGRYTYDKEVDDVIGAKVIIYRERDHLTKIDNYPDPCSIVETIKRFAIKAGLHYFGNDDSPIKITKMFFDGHQHHGRNIDKNRLVARMKNLRDYASIHDHEELIDDRQSNHDKPNSLDYDDCQLIQLTDLLVGAFRTSYGYSNNLTHKKITRLTTVNELVKKIGMGYKRMQNSRWHNSILTGQCFYTEGTGWAFEDLPHKKVVTFEQASLF